MSALRSLSRVASRPAARFSTKALRPPAALLRPAPVLRPASSAPLPRFTAAFHQSAATRQDGGGVIDELVTKLQSEIAVEEDMQEDEDLSANIKEYLESSPFDLQDQPGHQEVVLTRSFGDEKIRIIISTADLSNNNTSDELDDNAMYDDVDLDTQSGGATTKGAIDQGRTPDGNLRIAPDDRQAPNQRDELDEEDYEDDVTPQGFPAHASIRIERPGRGALAIEAVAQDGDILIESLSYFPSADTADPTTAEQDWARRALYIGPPFNNLDEDLQLMFERYLEERDIGTRLALFIPDYIDHKEQKEYIRWLKDVKSFIE